MNKNYKDERSKKVKYKKVAKKCKKVKKRPKNDPLPGPPKTGPERGKKGAPQNPEKMIKKDINNNK